MNDEQNSRLLNQTAVVTGSSSGIGKSIAIALAAEGANVALVGRRLPLLSTVTQECAQMGVKAVCYQVDLSNLFQIQQLREKVVADFESVDILVHSAGMFSRMSVAQAKLSDFDQLYHVNLRAPFALTQVFLPNIRDRKGQIVFINSTAGLHAPACISQYAATKHGLKALADSLRDEVNSDGVRVLSIYLGRTATPMQATVHEFEGRPYHPELLIQPEQVAAAIIGALALGPEAEIVDLGMRATAKPCTKLKQ